MRVAEIWRYPVKSMAGEPLTEALLTPGGIPGDRVVQVAMDGRVITSRTHPRLLAFKARLGPDGEPLVDGRPWDEPDVAAAVSAAVGPAVRLVRDEGPERFDMLPLLVATDGAIRALGHDRRRLRPNLVIEGVEGLAERGWPGRGLRIGQAVIGLRKLRSRCVMTTFDPDTLEQDLSVLRRIAREFGGRMALDSDVVEGGLIRVGDPVELI
ncbi:MAG TPA: MOSC N-terminal beta barrel domain-containing protein [Methylomirabilota bacterium]|nr:MOSC N-terminal beta barrel domain-containing protein [Methylomirabilota bacterium]